jgi:hypothetical protein
MGNIKIERKKFWPTVWSLFMLFVFSMFLYASILGLLKKQYDFWFDYIFVIIFLIISTIGLIYGLKYTRISLIKVLSSSPEFEMNDKEIILNDNPKYNRLPFKDMIEANVYSSRYSLLIGISFKQHSSYGLYLNNLQRKVRNIPIEKAKIIFLSLEFADIKADDLRDLINEKIEMNKAHTANK